MVIELTNESFESEVLKESGVVLVDLYATWCGPCKALAPVVHKIAEEKEGSVKVAKIDIDQNMEIAKQYLVQSIPTLLFFKDGEVKETMLGLQEKGKIEEVLNRL
ncbi:thioredoxin [Anaeromicropila herbilytica]|uniref:Thioredoxin n=2 Tax=Anaeromicropila herbilytica TaxID=2785025 RepID=A0A7R7EQ53_9FIRM|nr:thioredoxin [Anaeromicropila herbilytica]